MKSWRDAFARATTAVAITLVLYVGLSGPLGGISAHLMQRSRHNPVGARVADSLHRAYYSTFKPLMWAAASTGTAGPLLWYWSLCDFDSMQS